MVNFWVAVDNPDASNVKDHKSDVCKSRFFTGNAFEECDKGKSRGALRAAFSFLSPLQGVICKPAWYKALYEEKV